MVPYADFVFFSELAAMLHAIVWWQIWPDGSYQPLLMPVDDATWRQIVQ